MWLNFMRQSYEELKGWGTRKTTFYELRRDKTTFYDFRRVLWSSDMFVNDLYLVRCEDFSGLSIACFE